MSTTAGAAQSPTSPQGGATSKQCARRPANTAFKQQRLKAWQPLITPKSVLPTLFILGFLFTPFGAFLLQTSSSVSELIVDYTDCDKLDPGAPPPASAAKRMPTEKFEFNGPGFASSATASEKNQQRFRDGFSWSYAVDQPALTPNVEARVGVCTVRFALPIAVDAPVFLYYRLTNYFQNHRRYVRSYSLAQLQGKDVSTADLQSACESWSVVPGTPAGQPAQVFYPCGLIASSMFNDTFSAVRFVGPLEAAGSENDARAAAGASYAFGAEGIAWESDKARYKGYGSRFDAATMVPPYAWRKRYGEKYKAGQDPDFISDERFYVWMRTAGLPNFRKLYGRMKSGRLEPGVYEVQIEYNYNVHPFSGTKSLVISTVSFLGGRNPFLGYAYIVVGVVCIVLAVVFAVRHLYKPRKLGDHKYLSWNKPQASGNGSGNALSSGAPQSNTSSLTGAGGGGNAADETALQMPPQTP